MWQTYASAVTKNLGLGLILVRVLLAIFLSCIRPLWSHILVWKPNILTYIIIVCLFFLTKRPYLVQHNSAAP